MTKAELERDRDEWKQQAESLQDDLDSLNEYVDELENENYTLTNNIGVGIKDLDNFTFRLKQEELYTPEIEAFMRDYLKFHND